MGLTCSLLGHEYGEPETEREREERGDEVVEYVRTVEYCDRCGRERIVSESTEVRSVRQAPPSVADDDGAAEKRDEDGLAAAFERVENEGSTSGEPAQVSEPAEFVDAAASAVAGTSTASDEGGSTASGDADAAMADAGDSPTDDDAEFITDDGDGPAGPTTSSEAAVDDVTDEAGAVDDTAGADTAGDAAAWPATNDDESANDAVAPGEEAPTDDAVILTDDGDDERERERERGAWPSSDDTRETERTTTAETDDGDESERAARTGIASAGPIEGASERERRGELVCPECGKRTGASGSSLRAGDICPDCHRGYLAESPESA